jgi:phosphoglycerate kinase
LVWNGPVGAFETPPFDRATVALAKRVAELTQAKKLLSVAALAAAGVEDQLTYVLTAGGAFLEWMEGKEPQGVAALAVT